MRYAASPYICAACVCRGVVEVIALLGSVQRGLCGSTTVRAIVDKVAVAVEDKPRPATRRHQRPTGRVTLLEHRHRSIGQ